jgi:hypothetical protein
MSVSGVSLGSGLDAELDRLAQEKLESFKEGIGKSEFSARKGKLKRNSIDNPIPTATDLDQEIGGLDFGIGTMDPSRQTVPIGGPQGDTWTE